jgi:hypothetical protein
MCELVFFCFPNLDTVTQKLLNHFVSNLYPRVTWNNRSISFVIESVDRKYLQLGKLNGLLNGVLLGSPRCINSYFEIWAKLAIESGLLIANKHKGSNGPLYPSEALSKIIKPQDHLPRTVTLPNYFPDTIEKQKQILWQKKQQLIASYTQYGWDEERRTTDWNSIELALKNIANAFDHENRFTRQLNSSELLMEVVDCCFDNKYPINFKMDTGLGYWASSYIENFEQLLIAYQCSYGQSVCLEEVIDDPEIHMQCVVIGPEIIITALNSEGEFYQQCQPGPASMSDTLRSRINDYIDLISVYFGLSIYSCEFLVKDDAIYPIGLINPHPEITFPSLNVHYPKAFTCLITWSYFVGVSQYKGVDEATRRDLLKVLINADFPIADKLSYVKNLKNTIYDLKRYEQFRHDNFIDIEKKLKSYFYENTDELLLSAISDEGSIPEERYTEIFGYFENSLSEYYFKQSVV